MTNAELINELRYCFATHITAIPWYVWCDIAADAIQTLCDELATYHAKSVTDEKRIAELERDWEKAATLATEYEAKAIELEAKLPKEGEWLRTDAFPHRIYCSVCYKTYVPNDRWQIWVDGDIPKKFCPNCGAKMKGEQE